MKIAVTSGKGGSGKTFIATHLAREFAQLKPTEYIDCDVEAPNGYLFLKPDNTQETSESCTCIESVDMEKCILCGKCARTCYSKAILAGRESIMVFPELCRYCAACEVVCPQNAMVKGKRPMGSSFSGTAGNIKLNWAKLATGAGGLTVKLIDGLTSKATSEIVILDSPPGTSCPVVHTVQDADIVILAADATEFGQHDLKLSVAMCREMNIEPLLIINRIGIGDIDKLRKYCQQENLTVLGEVNDSREIASYYSKGQLAGDFIPELKQTFKEMTQKLIKYNLAPSQTKGQGDQRSGIYLAEPNQRKDADARAENNSNAREIAVLSGKGGTGKTSLAACLAQLSGIMSADCDVDAADLHLLLKPEIKTCSEFIGGKAMKIDQTKCRPCGQCKYICQFNAVEKTPDHRYHIDQDKCEGCGACLELCPQKAITASPSIDGRLYMSDTRFGKMSHATLAPSRENSGKLVTTVRNQALAAVKGSAIIIDGSPGTGCPVIASIGGVSFVVLVTEPTVSGLHDLDRIGDLCRHFKVKAGVVVNKADLNSEMAGSIEDYARKNNMAILGNLNYSNDFNAAQQAGKTILEYASTSEIAGQIKDIWNKIDKEINQA
ncbi:MAG: 4Fe-4S binding protein [Sedimentisphaerales bacterium]|nr:4Fe-4S binding protein [Sedimentisphaerales bacterium]MBN2842175.1 4Fe-4S binding protein [Sedimentisphaerales bacterium]